MTDHEEWNAEIDVSDPAVAYNFGLLDPAPGTPEADAFAEMADYARREVGRVEADRESDAKYAAWKKANPKKAARAEADFAAASKRAHPLLWGIAPSQGPGQHHTGRRFANERREGPRIARDGLA